MGWCVSSGDLDLKDLRVVEVQDKTRRQEAARPRLEHATQPEPRVAPASFLFERAILRLPRPQARAHSQRPRPPPPPPSLTLLASRHHDQAERQRRRGRYGASRPLNFAREVPFQC